MPLQKQVIDVPFGLGIDTQTDDKNVLPGKLVTLENGQIDKLGRVTKRPGIAQVLARTGTLYADKEKMFLREDALANSGKITVLGKTGSEGRVSGGGAIFSRLVGKAMAVAGAQSCTNVDADFPLNNSQSCVYGNAVSVEAGVGYTVFLFDYETRLPTIQSFVASSTVQNGRVLKYLSTTFVVGLYFNTGVLTLNLVTETTTSLTIGTPVTVSGQSATARWDWVLDGNNLFVTTIDAAGTLCTVYKYDITNLVAAPSTVTFAVAGVTALGIGSTSSTTVGVFWATAAGVFYRGYSKSALALSYGTITVHNVAGTYELIGATQIGSTSAATLLIQESSAPTATYNRRILASSMQENGTGWSPVTVPGVGLASKPENKSGAWASTYDTPLQRTLLFHRLSANTTADLLGRTFYGTHGGLQLQHCLPQAIAPNTPKQALTNGNAYNFFVAQPVQRVSVATGATPAGSYSPGYADGQFAGGTIESGGSRPYPSAVVDGELIFGGGYLHSITSILTSSTSGLKVVPHGFLITPEIVSVAPSAAGGSIADGVYSVICTYEYVDHRGRVFESGPSLPVSGTVSGGGGAGKLTVTVQTYRLEAIRAVYIVFYRTLPGGTTYYRERRLANSPTINSTSQDLTLANTTLDDSAILYCGAGGEQENAQPDGPVAMCSDQDRLWVVPGSNLSHVVPSKPITGGVGAAFFPDAFRQVASSTGINALARQDGKVLALDATSTHVAGGSGPDATGANDNLGDFQILFPHVGAERVDAVLAAPVGMYIKSATEIWFIGRDLQVQRVGAPVEAYTSSARYLGAAYHVALRQARFIFGRESPTTSPTFELVLDEDTEQWSYNTRQASADYVVPSIVYFNDVMQYMMPLAAGSAVLAAESASLFTDLGVGYSLKFVTAWLKPAAVLQGFGRIYRALILGDFLSTHTLQVRVRYDYETAWSETHTISSLNATGGTGLAAYQAEIRFSRQKCESFQLEITDTGATGTGQAYQLSGLELLVGAKSGTNRQSNVKRF